MAEVIIDALNRNGCQQDQECIGWCRVLLWCVSLVYTSAPYCPLSSLIYSVCECVVDDPLCRVTTSNLPAAHPPQTTYCSYTNCYNRQLIIPQTRRAITHTWVPIQDIIQAPTLRALTKASPWPQRIYFSLYHSW